MRKLITFLILLNLNLLSFGAYLENIPVQLRQPNGEILNLFISGDEFFRRVHDSEDYSIVQGVDGWYYYAVYDAGKDELVPSIYVVSASRNFTLPIKKGIGISYEKYMQIRQDYYEPTGCDASGMSKKSILKDLAADDSKATQQINNIIICIGFSDTPEMTNNHTAVNGLFNTNASNNLRDYFMEMSYNKVDIYSHFYPPANGTTLRFYRAPNPRSYYEDIGPSSTSNRPTVEHTLLRDAINWVNANHPIPSSLNLDINNDGRCDYISFVVYGQVGEWSWMLWPHKWSLYTYNVSINGKRVYDYNFELDGTSSYFNVGTFCHEGYHQLGAPDLYHYTDYTDIRAVGSYDVMDNTNNSKPQSMSAYMKYKYGYGNWITSLPIATINRTYEVFPFYSNDGTDPSKPVIYRIPMTGINTQYSVVEYRKKTGTNYDSSLLNEGLMIYRINTSLNGNAQFDGSSVFDEVYLYRQGSAQSSGSGVYTQGDLSVAPYNSINGRTSFNSSTNPKPCRSNGTAESTLDINNILYDDETDSYTFFYGNAANRSMVLDKSELELANLSGASGTVTVTSNVLWRISIPPDAASWLSVSKIKGMNTETVSFTATGENISGVIRTATVAFAANGSIFYLNVKQDSPPPVCKTPPDYDFSLSIPSTSWKTHSGSIAINGCYVYRVPVTSEQRYTFKTGCGDGATANFDTYLYLYNSSGSILTSNDDDCEPYGSIINGYQFKYTGYAYLQVKGQMSDYGNYTLAYRDARFLPTPPEKDSVTLCKPGMATLTASDPYENAFDFTFNWYADNNLHSKVHTGKTYTFPCMTPDMSYYLYVTATVNGYESEATQFVVWVNNLIEVSIVADSPIICNDGDGILTAVGTGGSGNFTYLWNTGETTPTIQNLSIGTYSVTVSDGNSCQAHDEFSISYPHNTMPDFYVYKTSNGDPFENFMTADTREEITHYFRVNSTYCGEQELRLAVDYKYYYQPDKYSPPVQAYPINNYLSNINGAFMNFTTPLDNCASAGTYQVYNHIDDESYFPFQDQNGFVLLSHSYSFFRLPFLDDRQIKVSLSGFELPGIYTIEYELVTHRPKSGFGYYGNLIAGVQCIEIGAIGGNNFYTIGQSEESDYIRVVLGKKTMTIVVSAAPVSTVIQTIPLKSGINWVSFNVLNTSPSILDQVINSIGAQGISIRSHSQSINYSPVFGWIGSLTEISEKEMYKISVSNPISLRIEGTHSNTLTTFLTISPGYNWIGYLPLVAMSITDALASFSAAPGDQIKNDLISSEHIFYAGIMFWAPSIIMSPGCGYLYYSSDETIKTLFYQPASNK